MTTPEDPTRPPAQPSGGGWPEPAREEEPQVDVGWPEPEEDESQLEAWLDHRDEAAGTPGPQEPVAAVEEPAAEEPSPEPPAEPEGVEPAAEQPPYEPPVEQPLASPSGPGGDEHVDPSPAPPSEEPVEEPATAEEDLPAAAPRSSRRVLVAAGLAVLLGLNAFLAVTAVRTRGIGADEEGRRDAIGAARNAARLILSYDYRRLDKDVEAALATTTGDFRAEYTRTTAALKKDGVQTRYKAVVVAEVSDAAVVTGDAHRAQVLVFLNQLSTSTLSSAPKVTKSRVLMRLVEKDGRWLVEEVDAI